MRDRQFNSGRKLGGDAEYLLRGGGGGVADIFSHEVPISYDTRDIVYKPMVLKNKQTNKQGLINVTKTYPKSEIHI